MEIVCGALGSSKAVDGDRRFRLTEYHLVSVKFHVVNTKKHYGLAIVAYISAFRECYLFCVLVIGECLHIKLDTVPKGGYI